MKGTIDFRSCKASIKEIFFDNLVVPIETGSYEHDFDVIMDECSPQFIGRYILKTRRRLRKRRKKGVTIKTELMPIGVNLRTLPTEAIIVLDA